MFRYSLTYQGLSKFIFCKIIQEIEAGVLEYLLAKIVDRTVLFKVSKKTDPSRRDRSSYSVTRICDDAEVLARFRTAYVQREVS